MRCGQRSVHAIRNIPSAVPKVTPRQSTKQRKENLRRTPHQHKKEQTVTGFTHERPGEGETNEWYTPKTFFTQLGEHITFDLDPCSPGVGLSHVPARRVFTKDDDGLTQQGEGLVFCNPPYGREVGLWAEKCAAHGNSMALVFARVDTAWFHKAVATADGVFFLAGRVKFHKGSIRNPNKGNASAGSCLILWGEAAMRIVENSDLLGVLMKPVAPAAAGE